jgi:hypothetical protein
MNLSKFVDHEAASYLGLRNEKEQRKSSRD